LISPKKKHGGSGASGGKLNYEYLPFQPSFEIAKASSVYSSRSTSRRSNPSTSKARLSH